ncbi:hypothetical protein [Acinetobacter sp. 197]|uniref:hypothetical protein n=1 Tax=Acinetobacter sp. 197 TaxID=3114696 RepID=UPI003A881388
MGGSSSQVVGYRYYAKFAAFIGNRIEKLLAINFDNRGWLVKDKGDASPHLEISKLSLYGENEGGVSGNIDIHFGTPDQEPNEVYQQYLPLVSGYPYQSYLVFRGLTSTNPLTGKQTTAPGFYLGNSGYMKEMLLWVQRIHVRNDGREQWYDEKAEIGYYFKFTEANKFLYTQKFTSLLDGKVVTPGGEKSTETTPFEYTGSYAAADRRGLAWSIGGTLESVESNDPVDSHLFYLIPQIGVVAHIEFSINTSTLAEEVEYEVIGTLAKPLVISQQYPQTLISAYFIIPKGRGYVAVGIKARSNGIVFENGSPRIGANISARMFECYVFEQYVDFGAGDINPIHKIREILTGDTAMGKPESDVNDENFIKAADRIYDEGLGISWAIDEKSCIEAIEELCYHIEAGIRVNRQTGLYEMVLFRDDWFSEDEIHDIAENKIKDLSLEVMNSDDIVNQLNVTYYDRERIKNSTFSVYENGSILTMGHANAESAEFPYFMNMRNAEVVANWKLKQFSTPAWSGSFSTGWKEARKWNRYDLIRLPWSKKWNGTILARIMKINLGNGTDNTVTIDFEEVIPYSGEMNTSIVVDAPIDSTPQPPQSSDNAIFEAPYYLTVLRAGQTNADLELSNNPDIGYVAAIAAKPQSNSLNALLYTDGGVGEFEQVSRLDYCDILQLDQPIAETSSSFTVTGSLTQVANSNNLILLNDELMGFVSFDDETKVLTVKRGVLDTVPKKHSSGSLFVFDLPDVAFDSTQYAQSEVVEAQVLTTTPSGIQSLSGTGVPVEIKSRAIRPYPPANVKINNVLWPETLLVSSDLVVSWVHRNRIQQTGGVSLGFYDAGIAAELGVTYSLELSTLQDGVLLSADNINADNYVIPEATILPNKAHKLKLWSVRDDYDSYQIYEHSFFAESASLILTATTNGEKVEGNTVPTANISVNVDTSLKANMQFDGSKITGKASANSVITIEVEE